jgi:hypothetical protein
MKAVARPIIIEFEKEHGYRVVKYPNGHTDYMTASEFESHFEVIKEYHPQINCGTCNAGKVKQ